MTKPRGAVVFDWNGTLFDDIHEVHRAFTAIQAAYGHGQSTVEEFRQHFDMPVEKLYLGLGFSNDEIQNNKREMWARFHAAYAMEEEQVILRDGAKKVMADIRGAGAHCVILSNHVRDPIATACKNRGLSGYINEVLANKDAEEQTAYRPKKERLLAYLKQNEIANGNTVIVGDTPEEIRIAHEYGLIGVAITGGFASEARLVAEKPDHLIHHLEELTEIAQSLFGEAEGA